MINTQTVQWVVSRGAPETSTVRVLIDGGPAMARATMVKIAGWAVEGTGMAETEVFEHWCEVCGKTEMLTIHQAYNAEWDFPPKIGDWRVLSPRTCGSCPINATVWWAVAMDDGDDARQPSDDQLAVITRIRAEKLAQPPRDLGASSSIPMISMTVRPQPF